MQYLQFITVYFDEHNVRKLFVFCQLLLKCNQYQFQYHHRCNESSHADLIQGAAEIRTQKPCAHWRL